MGPPQHRYASAPGGGSLWVPVTDDDRRRVVDALPAPVGWREAVKMREDGRSLEDISRHVRCSPEQLEEGLSVCYQWIETELHNLAMERAGGPHMAQAHVDADVLQIMEVAERELAEQTSG